MRIKSTLVAVVVFLSSFLAYAVEAAAAKAGTSCAKLNQKTTSAGYTYTCMKLGKKLVWSKGVKVVSPAPMPSPTPSPSPTSSENPTPTPMPSSGPSAPRTPVIPVKPGPVDGDPPLKTQNCSGWYYYRINNGILERSFYATEGYSASDSRLDSTFDPILLAAYNNVWNRALAARKSSTSIVTEVSPNFDPIIAASIQSQTSFLANFWGDQFPQNSVIRLQLLTERDSALARDSYAIGKDSLITQMQRIVNEPSSVECGLRSGGGGGGGFGNTADLVNFYPSIAIATAWNPFTAVHEFTHIVQNENYERYRDYYPSARDPGNFVEGSATFFGTALAMTKVGWFQDELMKGIRDIDSGLGVFKITDISSMINLLNVTEGGVVNQSGKNQASNDYSYSVGALLFTYEIGTYGMDSYIRILKNQATTDSFNANLLKSIGISKDQLYADAAPFMLKMWTKAVNWGK
jgi:hypothetical protein